MTPFVGRAAELDEVAGQLRTRRLVTLTGAGGVGKTRLAVQAALVAAEHYPDGVWMLELAALSEETMVPSALAAMLGVRQGGPDSFEAVEQLVCGYLAGRRVLLVLDNCEHVVGAVARLVHAVLTACPSLSVLATSRALLGVTGETAWTVPPLSLPAHDRADMREMLACDAVAFFCERAQAARSQFQLSPSNALAVIGICRRLDGIPLALELAAARVRMLSVNQIAERLADCFALLTGGPRTAVPRHRTLRAALDWSYDLLSAEEQTALQRLAVFPDHFDLEAAAAVLAGNGPGSAAAGIDGNGFDLLALLVEKSLVVVHPRGEEIRYRLLEPIRQYAGGKLAQAGDTDAARGHHRDFFLQRSEMFRRFSLGGLAHSHRFFVDQANYRAALEWSWQEGNLDAALSLVHAHWPAWRSTGDPRGRQWLERVLAQPEPAEHPVRPLLHAVLANQLQNSGQPDPEREEQLMREAAALARRSGDPQLIAAIDFGWAELELAWGKTAQARTLMEAALAAYERFESPANVGWCHDHLGWVAVAECDYHRAHDHFQRAAESAGLEAGDPWLAAHALAALAPLTVLVDDPERGRRLADEAIAAARNLATPSVLHMALTRAAETEIVGGDHPRAGPILAELLQLLSDVGSRWWLADALEMAALVLESQADPATAAEILGASEALRAVSGETPGGSRPVGAELAPGRDRLIAVLGADHFAHHQARGRKLTPEAAAAAALRALGAPTPMSAI